MELCSWWLEGKEKQVVASFVQLTEANWTHLGNVSSSIQCLLQKAQILGGEAAEIFEAGAAEILEFKEYWAKNMRSRMSGFDLQLASIASPKMARIWLLRDYGDTDMERQRYNCCGIGGSGARDSVVSCSASWRGSQEERYELNSATYCPIVPLWPTYMGLVSVGG